VPSADLVICSAATKARLLTAEKLTAPLERIDHPLLIIDIAVPRNADPALGELPDVCLRSIDDLDELIARNIQRRQREIPKAEAIVEAEVSRFGEYLSSLEVTSTIKLLHDRVRQVREELVQRHSGRFTDADLEQLDRFAGAICRRILHDPIAFMKGLSTRQAHSSDLAAVDMLRKIFDLGPDNDSP